MDLAAEMIEKRELAGLVWRFKQDPVETECLCETISKGAPQIPFIIKQAYTFCAFTSFHHELQGAGWRSDGTFVAYGLGNYLWFKGAGDDSPDNGVLTLTFRGGKVIADTFQAAHLDDRGVPVPAIGATKERIDAEWADRRGCAGLSPRPA